jgi:hypothetical protein
MDIRSDRARCIRSCIASRAGTILRSNTERSVGRYRRAYRITLTGRRAPDLARRRVQDCSGKCLLAA